MIERFFSPKKNPVKTWIIQGVNVDPSIFEIGMQKVYVIDNCTCIKLLKIIYRYITTFSTLHNGWYAHSL